MIRPPRSAQRNARQALGCIIAGSQAMTSVGRGRARQLASGKPISIRTVKKMAAFERHRKNSEYSGNPCKDNGHVAWQGWGGSSGIRWARSIIKKRAKK